MEIVTVRDLTFSYPEQNNYPALHNLSFTVKRGDFFVICGFSGCGKSTLLRQLKPTLSPYGSRSGTILFEGKPLHQFSHEEQARMIGFVQQNPDHQLVTDKVWHELAFGLESLGYDTPTIRRRVAEMASFFGMQTWFHKDVNQLSGGQKQLLNLASVMVMQPSVLILDEPTSQLDPIAAMDFFAMLDKINRELGTTIILTEHSLDEVLPLATRVMVMDVGQLLCEGTPHEIGDKLKAMEHGMFLAMPTAMQVWAAVENNLLCPLTVREGREWLHKYDAQYSVAAINFDKREPLGDTVCLRGQELWFRYDKDGVDVVKGLSLSLRKGELLALLGGNGTGKTTALKLLSGLLKPYRGKVEIYGTVGILPQNPQTLFVKNTVQDDLREVCTIEEKLIQVIAICHLEQLLNRHPYDLSGGEQQRLALAKVLLLKPDILFMDEPTKGLDAQFKAEMGSLIETLLLEGISILMVSHDIEFCAQYAHRCALFFDGDVVTEETPREFFSGNRFYTTAANRMARDIEVQAITAEDVIALCGGQSTSPSKSSGQKETNAKEQEPKEHSEQFTPDTSPPSDYMQKSVWMATVMLMLIVPATLWIGLNMDGQSYYFIALVVLMEAMLPFFFLFEKRKPKARELVVVAVLCAIAVAGRAVFFMLPQFKPVMALAILSGVALGSETGFLVGAMSMLVSNTLFGQGAWTPWQMFAMGLIGFLSGVLFRKNRLPHDKLTLSIFGIFSAIFLYGGIMNPASALMWTQELNWEILLAYYISGFPMDCVHAVATAVFLWFGSEIMLEKLERVKMKYGLLAR